MMFKFQKLARLRWIPSAADLVDTRCLPYLSIKEDIKRSATISIDLSNDISI